jgi:hypothetical protein
MKYTFKKGKSKKMFPKIPPKPLEKKKFVDVATQVILADLATHFEGIQNRYGHLKTDQELAKIFLAAGHDFWAKHKPQRLI